MNQAHHPPAGYVQAVERAIDMLRDFKASGLELRFRVPPKSVAVIVDLEHVVDYVGLNEPSRAVLRRFAKLPGGFSLVMLCVALEMAGVNAELLDVNELRDLCSAVAKKGNP